MLHFENQLKQIDRRRYIARLLAPAEHRSNLSVFDLFACELASIAEKVSNPAAGEIRLQWWHEILQGKRTEEAQGNPVAAALLTVLNQHYFPSDGLTGVIEERRNSLYQQPLRSIADYEAYCGKVSAVIAQHAVSTLVGRIDPATADAAGYFGVADECFFQLLSFVRHRDKGLIFMPEPVLSAHGLSVDDALAITENERLTLAFRDWAALGLYYAEQAELAIMALPKALRSAFLPIGYLSHGLSWLARYGQPNAKRNAIPAFANIWASWWTAQRMKR